MGKGVDAITTIVIMHDHTLPAAKSNYIYPQQNVPTSMNIVMYTL